MPQFLRFFLHYVVFWRHYYLYCLLCMAVPVVIALLTGRPFGTQLLPEFQPPNDVVAQLNRRSPGVNYECEKGEGGWAYLCDRYTALPNSPLTKDRVGIDTSLHTVDVVAFPAGFAVSRAEMKRWEREQKRFMDLIDLNGGKEGKIATLPGIDRALARRIVAASQQQAFVSVDDVRRVDGMAPQMVERIRPLVRAGLNGKPKTAEFFAGRELKARRRSG